MKNEKLIICGPSGAGKDFLQREIIKKDLRFEPKLTTRPKRDFETDGIDYIYTNNEQFESMLNNNEIFTYQSFNIESQLWYYAITKSNFNNNQIFIMTPHEIKQIDETDRKNCFIVYLDIDILIRESRVLKRKDMNDSVYRRFASDYIDFLNFTDYDMRVTDPDFSADLVYQFMH
jgi:guanylate kinase